MMTFYDWRWSDAKGGMRFAFPPYGPTVLVSLGLMLTMPAGSWWRLALWLLSGLAVYCIYAWHKGRLGADSPAPD